MNHDEEYKRLCKSTVQLMKSGPGRIAVPGSSTWGTFWTYSKQVIIKPYQMPTDVDELQTHVMEIVSFLIILKQTFNRHRNTCKQREALDVICSELNVLITGFMRLLEKYYASRFPSDDVRTS